VQGQARAGSRIDAAAKRQAEEVAAQRHEHGLGNVESLFLPRASLVWLARQVGVLPEPNRCHVAPPAGQGQAHGPVVDDPALLAEDIYQIRFHRWRSPILAAICL
jgi:hypothetical protein